MESNPYARERRRTGFQLPLTTLSRGASPDNAHGRISSQWHLRTACARLVLIGFVMAVPFAYYAMQQDFAYRITIGPGIFLMAGGLALGLAFLTVSYQSVQAALTNPAESLRYE